MVSRGAVALVLALAAVLQVNATGYGSHKTSFGKGRIFKGPSWGFGRHRKIFKGGLKFYKPKSLGGSRFDSFVKVSKDVFMSDHAVPGECDEGYSQVENDFGVLACVKTVTIVRDDTPVVAPSPPPVVSTDTVSSPSPSPVPSPSPSPSPVPSPSPPPVDPPVPPPSQPPPSPSPAPKCPSGQFYMQKVEFKGCSDCDGQCVAGKCVDIDGCLECQPGYFSYREDPEWPYECRKCAPGCATCTQGITEGEGESKCLTYEPEDECPVGQFFMQKVEFQGCSDCDGKCVDGKCQDIDGCLECQPGYYSWREDPEWPYECKKCPAGCATCTQGITQGEGETECLTFENEGKCPSGQYYMKKVEFQGCSDCDAKCAAGQCVDIDGCLECKPGYYSKREDPEWPYECASCESAIPGCKACTQKITYGESKTKCLHY